MEPAATSQKRPSRNGDAPLELPDDLQIDQGAGDVELQAELLPHFGGELEDRVLEFRAISPRLLRLINRPGELAVDDLLGTFEARVGVEFLTNDFVSFLERHDLGRGDLQLLDTLRDGRAAHTEMLGGVGLRMSGVEVLLEGVGIDLESCHWA